MQKIDKIIGDKEYKYRIRQFDYKSLKNEINRLKGIIKGFNAIEQKSVTQQISRAMRQLGFVRGFLTYKLSEIDGNINLMSGTDFDKMYEEPEEEQKAKQKRKKKVVCNKCNGNKLYPQSNGDLVFCFKCNGKGYSYVYTE